MEHAEALDGLDVQAFYDTLAELRRDHDRRRAAEAEDAPAVTDAPLWRREHPPLPLLRWAAEDKDDRADPSQVLSAQVP
ncbi:MAG: hypothetical protein ACLSAF_05440 [Intestinimonas sp.]